MKIRGELTWSAGLQVTPKSLHLCLCVDSSQEEVCISNWTDVNYIKPL